MGIKELGIDFGPGSEIIGLNDRPPSKVKRVWHGGNSNPLNPVGWFEYIFPDDGRVPAGLPIGGKDDDGPGGSGEQGGGGSPIAKDLIPAHYLGPLGAGGAFWNPRFLYSSAPTPGAVEPLCSPARQKAIKDAYTALLDPLSGGVSPLTDPANFRLLSLLNGLPGVMECLRRKWNSDVVKSIACKSCKPYIPNDVGMMYEDPYTLVVCAETPDRDLIKELVRLMLSQTTFCAEPGCEPGETCWEYLFKEPASPEYLDNLRKNNDRYWFSGPIFVDLTTGKIYPNPCFPRCYYHADPECSAMIEEVKANDKYIGINPRYDLK